jgi:hypothetical protein
MAEKNKRKVEVDEKKIDEQVKSVKQKIRDSIDLDKILEYVKKNKIEFEYEGKKYRVRKPIPKERQEVSKLRMEKHVSLLKEKDENGDFKYMSERDLINLYKERGVNIDDMDKKLKHYRKKEQDLMFKLGKAIKEKKGKNELDVYKKEIVQYRELMQELGVKKTQLLELSIEQQIMIFVYSYFTSKITEKLEKEKWVNVWESYDDFLNDTEELTNKAISHAVLIINNVQ